MGNMFDSVGPIMKREMVLFFLIDQSGSMAGNKMGAVNNAIREVIPEIREAGGANAEIKIAVLMFSTSFRWMYSEPIPAGDFAWESIEADGMTDMGAAFSELETKLSKNAFLKAPSASVAPAIFLMSDGLPTDDYRAGLNKLKGNNWFKYAIKVAVAIGNDADTGILTEFTGTSEAVIKTHTPQALVKMIRFISVTSSRVGTRSQNAGSRTKQDDVNQDIKDYLNENKDIEQEAQDQWQDGVMWV